MKQLMMYAVLILVGSIANANTFEQYAGCYDTVTLNGHKIPTNNESKYLNSEIKLDDEAFFYLDDNGSVIPSISLMLYQGFTSADGGTHNFDVHEAFLDRGTFSQKGNDANYAYAGTVSYRFQPEIKWQLTSNITISDVDADHIKVKAVRKVEGNTPGDMDVSDTYVLKRKSCE